MWKYVILECTLNSSAYNDRTPFKRLSFGNDYDNMASEVRKFNDKNKGTFPRKFRIVKEIKKKLK